MADSHSVFADAPWPVRLILAAPRASVWFGVAAGCLIGQALALSSSGGATAYVLSFFAIVLVGIAKALSATRVEKVLAVHLLKEQDRIGWDIRQHDVIAWSLSVRCLLKHLAGQGEEGDPHHG